MHLFSVAGIEILQNRNQFTHSNVRINQKFAKPHCAHSKRGKSAKSLSAVRFDATLYLEPFDGPIYKEWPGCLGSKKIKI